MTVEEMQYGLTDALAWLHRLIRAMHAELVAGNGSWQAAATTLRLRRAEAMGASMKVMADA